MTLTLDPNQSRARLAWLIVWGSFALFLALCAATPILANAYIQRATIPLLATLTTSQGTVAVGQAGNGGMVALPLEAPPLGVKAGAAILTNPADTAALLIADPASERLLGRIQIYGQTNLLIEQASAPRFGLSQATPELALRLTSGRVRLTLLSHPLYQMPLTLFTPQGQVTITEEGQYTVEVTPNETHVAVQAGAARLMATGQEIPLLLTADQRGLVPTDSAPQGPLSTERNLIRNGNFLADFSGWIKRDWNTELASEPTGETAVASEAGGRALRFTRLGVGHADAAVRQILNHDVSDYTSLHFLLSTQINLQTLGVCGTVGSECPLTVELDYIDRDGNRQVWRQGFYTTGVVATDTPDTCINCRPPYNPHVQIPAGRLFTYDVDLIDNLALQAFPPPRTLNSISLIAAGHGFEVEIVEVALLARE
jgi:hypothetical protein